MIIQKVSKCFAFADTTHDIQLSAVYIRRATPTRYHDKLVPNYSQCMDPNSTIALIHEPQKWVAVV